MSFTRSSARGTGRLAALFAVVATMGVCCSVGLAPAGTAGADVGVVTTSRYESTTATSVLYAQGAATGEAGQQGLVILDFGRPAQEGSVPGVVTFGDAFAPMADVASAASAFIQGYLATAPADLGLHLAIGTNNSCGTGQPCGSVICGCSDEPTSYSAWGAQLATTVESVQAWASSYIASSGDTDKVTVVAGDDAEPAYDPGYYNTYDLLAGYAGAVGGYSPAMVDYGSADQGFWSEAQLLQVANGFPPDVMVPELYSPLQVEQWTGLVSYALQLGQRITVFGVLTQAPVGLTPSGAFASLLSALSGLTGQSTIPWASNIGF